MTDALHSHDAHVSSRKLMLAVLAAAVAIRISVLVAQPAGLNFDTDGYRRIAMCLRTAGTFGEPVTVGPMDQGDSKSPRCRPTAFRPPLYPLLLAIFASGEHVSPVAVGALHLGLGMATVAIVFWLAGAWGLGRWSWLAPLLTACDPILLYQSTQIMTETLAAFLGTASLALLTVAAKQSDAAAEGPDLKRWGVLNGLMAGAMLGAASLCRPTFLPWTGLVVASFLLPRLSRSVDWKQIVALTCGLVLVLLPWGMRNYSQFGRFRVSTSHGGYTLLLGNNPSFYSYLREGAWGDVWRSAEFDQAWARRSFVRSARDNLMELSVVEPRPNSPQVIRDEFESDQLAYEFAQRYIREERRMFLFACLVRVGRLWGVLPHQVNEQESVTRYAMRLAVGGWYVVLFFLALVGTIGLGHRSWRAPWLWGLLLCLTFTAVHTVYWSDMRMRAPLMPVVCLAAVAGIEEIIRRMRRCA